MTQQGQARVLDGTQGVDTCGELGRLFAAAGLRILSRHGALDDKPFALGDHCLHLVAERV